MKPQWPKIRNFTLFMSGLLGVAHETLLTTTDRPSLIVAFSAMMGLPAVLGKDEKKHEKEKHEKEKILLSEVKHPPPPPLLPPEDPGEE